MSKKSNAIKLSLKEGVKLIEELNEFVTLHDSISIMEYYISTIDIDYSINSHGKNKINSSYKGDYKNYRNFGFYIGIHMNTPLLKIKYLDSTILEINIDKYYLEKELIGEKTKYNNNYQYTLYNEDRTHTIVISKFQDYIKI